MELPARCKRTRECHVILIVREGKSIVKQSPLLSSPCCHSGASEPLALRVTKRNEYRGGGVAFVPLP